MELAPPFIAPHQLSQALREPGYAVLSPQGLAAISGCSLSALDALRVDWDTLPPDTYLKDGGRYRRRRHSCFVVDGESVTQTVHRAHWQPVEYNALHGGMERWFEPMSARSAGAPVWLQLLRALAQICSALKSTQPWHVEAHQFRIDTAGGIGRPTPEGAHRDGVDLVAVMLVQRIGVKGGETRVFDADGPNGQRFTMTEPWTTLLLDDARVVHETTPVQPTDQIAHRDTLVLTFRAGGFQGPD